MRHGNHKYTLGVKPAHRVAMMRNLEKLITLAKVDSVANRRVAFSKLNNQEAVVNLFKIAPKFLNRNGGYTRIIKTADGRVGDSAPMSYIALVD